MRPLTTALHATGQASLGRHLASWQAYNAQPDNSLRPLAFVILVIGAVISYSAPAFQDGLLGIAGILG